MFLSAALLDDVYDRQNDLSMSMVQHVLHMHDRQLANSMLRLVSDNIKQRTFLRLEISHIVYIIHQIVANIKDLWTWSCPMMKTNYDEWARMLTRACFLPSQWKFN